MRLISFKKEWEEKLLLGDKIQTIRKKSKIYQPLIELKIFIGLRTKNCKFIGYTKIKGIKEFRWEELKNVSLNKDIKEFRRWLTIAQKDGFKTVYQLRDWLEEHCQPEPDDVFQIIEFFPVKKQPYEINSKIKEGFLDEKPGRQINDSRNLPRTDSTARNFIRLF